MSYEKKVTTTFCLSTITATATTAIRSISRLPGKRYCRIVDIQICASTECTGTTLSGRLNVGDGTTAAKFAVAKAGPDATAAALPVGSVYGVRDYDGRVAAYATSGNGYIDFESDGNAGAALSALVFTPAAPTGGSPAGVYSANVVLEWW